MATCKQCSKVVCQTVVWKEPSIGNRAGHCYWSTAPHIAIYWLFCKLSVVFCNYRVGLSVFQGFMQTLPMVNLPQHFLMLPGFRVCPDVFKGDGSQKYDKGKLIGGSAHGATGSHGIRTRYFCHSCGKLLQGLIPALSVSRHIVFPLQRGL